MGAELVDLFLKGFVALLVLLGDLLIKLLELIPDHSRERRKRRLAKSQLKLGLALLGRRRFDKADIHFGAALTLSSDIVNMLSKRERKKLLANLVRYPTGRNATRLLLDLGK